MPSGRKSASSLAFSDMAGQDESIFGPEVFRAQGPCRSLASVVFRVRCTSCTGALVLHREFLHALPVFVRGGRDHLDENIEVGASVPVSMSVFSCFKGSPDSGGVTSPGIQPARLKSWKT